MKKILLTGATGFIGKNILPYLLNGYEVLAPNREELNLLDEVKVEKYLRENCVDFIVHCANPTPAKNPLDKYENMLSESLHVYFNLRRCSDLYDKMFYLGSGAEYDKRNDIVSINEDQFGKFMPSDDYGFAKYIMNQDARNSNNIYNLRIFGCYGIEDAKSKFIRDAIDCCIENRAITIKQNCMFDYMYVEDLGRIISNILPKKLSFHDYNTCSGKRVSLKDIAEIVKKQMNNDKDIEIFKDGWNKEYTASNARLVTELGDFEFTSLDDGIARQIKWQKELIHV